MECEILNLEERHDGFFLKVKVDGKADSILFDEPPTEDKIQKFIDDIKEIREKQKQHLGKGGLSELKHLVGKKLDLSKNEKVKNIKK